MKKKNSSVIRYFALCCFCILGCLAAIGSGGGGGDENNDDENGIPSEIVGVWKITQVSHYSSDQDDCVTDSYPLTDSEGVRIEIYIKLDASGVASKYVRFSNIPDYISEEGYYDGLYFCNAENKTFSVEGKQVTDNTGESSIYSVSGNTLTLTLNESLTECSEVRTYTKADDASISGGSENCDMAIDSYDDDDNFYEIFSVLKI